MNLYTPEGLKKTTPFSEAIAKGATLLFVQSTADQMRAEYVSSKLGLYCASSRWMGQMAAFSSFQALDNYLHPDRILIVKAPELSHGVRVDCSRIIWIGDTGEYGTDLRATYAQSMARAKKYTDPDFITHVFAEVPIHD